MSTTVTVDPIVDPRWAALVAGPEGSLFSSPPWMAAVADTYGLTMRATLLLDDRGDPVGGLAYVDVDDLRGRRRVSLPFCDRVDPIAPDLASWNELAGSVVAAGVPLTMRCLHAHLPVQDGRFTETGRAAWHGTDLSTSPDAVLARLHPVFRRNVRAAERSGIRVRIGSELDDVRAFYALHRDLRKRKYHMLSQPFALFERVWKQFGDQDAIKVLLAEHDGRVVAGALYLVWNDVLYYKFGASLAEHLGVRPNEAIAWRAMQYGHERGLRLLDWGLSDLAQPGLVAYKTKMATEQATITLLRHEPASGDATNADRGREAGSLIDELVALFVRDDVPDEVTEHAGSLLYRYFC